MMDHLSGWTNRCGQRCGMIVSTAAPSLTLTMCRSSSHGNIVTTPQPLDPDDCTRHTPNSATDTAGRSRREQIRFRRTRTRRTPALTPTATPSWARRSYPSPAPARRRRRTGSPPRRANACWPPNPNATCCPPPSNSNSTCCSRPCPCSRPPSHPSRRSARKPGALCTNGCGRLPEREPRGEQAGAGVASPSNPRCPWMSWAPGCCCRSGLPPPALHATEPNRTGPAGPPWPADATAGNSRRSASYAHPGADLRKPGWRRRALYAEPDFDSFRTSAARHVRRRRGPDPPGADDWRRKAVAGLKAGTADLRTTRGGMR